VKDARAGVAYAPVPDRRRGWAVLSDYVALTKPRLNMLVVVTSAAGYYLGATAPFDARRVVGAVLGTALVAGGAAVLNQVYERSTDALMHRTRLRPLPDGRVLPEDARVYGLGLSFAGLLLLWLTSPAAATWLAVATLVTYVLIYTPMKRRSTAATLVGAVPGALPPLIGWAAANGTASIGGLALFAIVFLWQIPHFMAIAWLFREDYGRAGFPMLPVIDPDGRRTGREAIIYSVALLPVSLLPSYVGISGTLYLALALVLSIALLGLSILFGVRRSDSAARALFFGSIAYLPLLWTAMILDH
jgi:protoheme IX farnesyltransferase